MYISPSSLVPLTHITPILLNSTIPRSPSLSHSPAMHLSVLIINRHLLPPRTDSLDVNPSSTISSPTLRPMPALPQELPPLSCPLPPTSQYPPLWGWRHRSRQCQRRYGRRKALWSRPALLVFLVASSDNPRPMTATCGRNPCSTPSLQPGSSSPEKVNPPFFSIFFAVRRMDRMHVCADKRIHRVCLYAIWSFGCL